MRNVGPNNRQCILSTLSKVTCYIKAIHPLNRRQLIQLSICITSTEHWDQIDFHNFFLTKLWNNMAGQVYLYFTYLYEGTKGQKKKKWNDLLKVIQLFRKYVHSN